MPDADFVRKMVLDDRHFAEMGLDKLSEAELDRVGQWLLNLLNLCGARKCCVDEIRGDGHLVRLDDGSMWEVSSVDAPTADLWSAMDEIIVYEGRMYRIDDSEAVDVEEMG